MLNLNSTRGIDMKKQYILFSIIALLLIVNLGNLSAWTDTSFEQDLNKIDELKTKTNYGTYEIKESKWWDILKIWTEEKINEITLEENTDKCSDNCYAIKEITNLKPMPLIEDVRFYRDFGDEKWILWNSFTNWRVLVEEDVDVYETICEDGKEVIDTKNGTSYFEQQCYQNKTGTKKQWLPLDFEKEYNGTYKVKLEGGKKSSTKLDWQVKVNGEWLDSWAVWNLDGDFSSATTTGETLNVTDETGEGDSTGIYFKPDGKQFWTIGSGDDSVYEFNCTSAFDLSTCSHTSNIYDFSGIDTAPRGLTFNNNGSKIYIVGSSNDRIYQIPLTTPYDITTALYDNIAEVLFSHSIENHDGVSTGLTFNNDGTKLYVSGILNAEIAQYNCSTPWSLMSCSYWSAKTGIGLYPEDIQVSEDGTRIYVTQRQTQRLNQYTLSTPYDITTATYESYFGLQDSYPTGMHFSPLLNKIYEIGSNTDLVYEYSVSSEAEIILNSPEDDSIAYTNPVTFNATANVTGGATLTNMSLYTNETGSWGLRNTTDISSLNVFNDAVAYYTLNGNVLDSVGDLDGVNNGASTVDGKINDALFFDSGQNDRINLSKSSLLNPDHITISAWFNVTSLSGGDHRTIVGRWQESGNAEDSYAIQLDTIDGDDTINLNYVLDNGSTGTLTYEAPLLNEWHFLVWTINDSTSRLYLDGSLVDTGLGGTLNDAPTKDTYIGALFNLASNDFHGKIDEVGFWNRSISPSEVTYLYNGGNGYTYASQETSYTQTWTRTISDDIIWNVQACDSDGDCGFATSNYTVSLDATAPTIEINSGNGTFDYGILTQNHTINFTVTDTDLDKVWFNYNGTNTTITGATSGVMNSMSFPLVKDLYNATIYSNDSVGNVNSTLVEWDYNIFQTGIDYEETTITTTTEDFQVNITTPTAQSPTAYLHYNGTSYLSTKTGTSTEHIFSNEIDMETAGTYNFYWTISYGGNSYNTTTYQQNVSEITAGVIQEGSCPAGLTQVMNFTFQNANNFTALENMTVKYNFQYGVSDSTGAVSSGTLTDIAQMSLCLNLTESATYEIGYGELNYEKDDYTERRYYVFENTRVSNETINTMLYSVPDADSTSFLIEVRNPSLTPYVNKYVSLLRWYPSLNEYKVVEIGKTDDKGESVYKVKIEDVDYRIGVYETNGSLIYLANPIRMVCLSSPCSYTINVPSESSDLAIEIEGIEAVIEYSEGIFTLTYNDPSQNTEIMSLRVYRIGGTSETLICESNGTSFTGVLNCDVSDEDGTLKAVAVRTASPERPIAQLIIDTLTTVFTGTFGLFLQFMIIVTLAFMGIASPIAAIILAIIALLVGVLLFKTMTYPILIGVAVLGGIVIHFMRQNRN